MQWGPVNPQLPDAGPTTSTADPKEVAREGASEESVGQGREWPGFGLPGEGTRCPRSEEHTLGVRGGEGVNGEKFLEGSISVKGPREGGTCHEILLCF